MPLNPEQAGRRSKPSRVRSATDVEAAAVSDGAGGCALYEPMPVLDHGFVRVVDYMGDDAAVVQAARVSYGRGTKSVSASDSGLINYLMRHRHSTPFEMCEIKYAHQAADLRRATVDPPPHRQCE